MDKKYLNGYFTEKEGKFWKIMKCSLIYKDLVPDEKGYVRFDILPKKEPNDKGTHYACVNTWQPNKDEPIKTGTYGKSKPQDDFDIDSIPF